MELPVLIHRCQDSNRRVVQLRDASQREPPLRQRLLTRPLLRHRDYLVFEVLRAFLPGRPNVLDAFLTRPVD